MRVRRARAARSRPADALAGLSLLAGRSDFIVPAPASPAAFSLSPKSSGGYVAGYGPVRGRTILELLQGKGITLHVRDGRLLPVGERIAPAVVEVIERAERLLLGYLTGTPRCELHGKDQAPEAWTVAVGGLLMCEAHADGTVAA